MVETGGCTARAERRVGEGIAAPKPILAYAGRPLWAGKLSVVLVVVEISASRMSAGAVVWRRVVEQWSASADGWRKRGCGGAKMDSNGRKVVCNADGCELRGGRVSGGRGWGGGAGGGRRQIMQQQQL